MTRGVAVGILSGSLALLSDAGHMLSDAGGLGTSLAAISLATAGTAAAHRTYGWYRLEGRTKRVAIGGDDVRQCSRLGGTIDRSSARDRPTAAPA
jgi:hypothetical protein